MNILHYNQFQSLYIIQDKYVILDFLKNQMFDYKKSTYTPNYRYDKEYDEMAKNLDALIKDVRNGTLDITIITDYACNMRCLYCYEHSWQQKSLPKKANPVLVVDFIKQLFNSSEFKSVRINILGGEPLMSHNIEFLDEVIKKLKKLDIPTMFQMTTNGLNIVDYIGKIIEWEIRDFQITLDGMQKVQNTRRMPLDMIDGFEKITQGIDLLLNNKNISVSLRINVDKNNVDEIPELAKFIQKKQWNESNFYAYIYPVTYSGNKNYILDSSDVEIFEMILNTLRNQSKEIRDFFALDFHGIAYVKSILNGQLPTIRNKFCGHALGQYVISNTGEVYSCWWGAEHDDFKIGNIKNQKKINESKILDFSNRSMKNIERCKTCKFKYLCGGGCTFKEWIDNKTLDQGHCSNFDELIYQYLLYYYNFI